MKKIILTVTVLTLAVAGMQTAKAGGIHFGFSIGLPAPVVIAPPVAVVAPPPRVVYEAPAYCPPPPPVVVYRAPRYCPPPQVRYEPAPVIRFRFGDRDRWEHERRERGYWEHERLEHHSRGHHDRR